MIKCIIVKKRLNFYQKGVWQMSTNDDPVGPLLEQLASLLKFAQDNAGKELKVDEDIVKRLEMIQGMVDQFAESTLNILEQENIKPEDVARTIAEKSDQLKKEDQKLLKKSMQLGFDALLMKNALMTAKAMGEYSKAFTQELSEKKVSKKKIKERRKKFKRMGGDSKWVPL